MKQKSIVVTNKGTRVVEVDYIPTEPTREEIIAEKQMHIESHKAQIAETDYKIIKCSEAQLIGAPMPYDVEALHAERQALRDEINKLKEEL